MAKKDNCCRGMYDFSFLNRRSNVRRMNNMISRGEEGWEIKGMKEKQKTALKQSWSPSIQSIEELAKAYSGFCKVNLSAPEMAATVWRWGVSREFYLLCLGNANSNHTGISNIQASQIPCLNPPPSCRGVFPSTKRLYLSATCSWVVVQQGTNPQ